MLIIIALQGVDIDIKQHLAAQGFQKVISIAWG
jgi:hypothetical protein